MHVHDQQARNSIAPWVMFIVFVVGPCEALIPLFMYPAAQQSAGLVMSVALVFGAATLATMLSLVASASIGFDRFKLPLAGRRYTRAVAGASVALCGCPTSFTGL